MTKKQDIITLGASFDIPRDDVFLILQKVLDISSKALFLLDEIEDKYISEIEEIFQKQQSGVPLEYILGETEFYGHKFFVTHDTLIPRNDTEILVEKTVEHIKAQDTKTSLVDIGTGTGCIPISILKETGESIGECCAIDISPEALLIAKKNRDFHELSQKLELLKGDLFSPLQDKKFQNLIITANLPYIVCDDFGNIDDNVANHEPHTALFGGPNTGFELYEKLISQLQIIKAHSTTLFIEIGFDQGDIVRNFCKTNNIVFEIYKDNRGVERCVEMKIH